MKEPGYSDLAILNSKGTDVITEYNTKINGNNISVKLVEIYDNPKTGYQGYLYENKNNPGEYYLVHSGSQSIEETPTYNPNDSQYELEKMNDYYSNVYKSVKDGLYPIQADDGYYFLKNTTQRQGFIKVTQIGQSLGGEICQVLGSLEEFKNIETITYNSVGAGNFLDSITKFGKISDDFSNIKNYRYKNEKATTIAPHIGDVYTTDYVCKDNFQTRYHNMQVYTNNPDLDFHKDENFRTLLDPLVIKYNDVEVNLEFLKDTLKFVIIVRHPIETAILKGMITELENHFDKILSESMTPDNIVLDNLDDTSDIDIPPTYLLKGYVSIDETIYTIETGDTICDICDKYDIPEDILKELNPWLPDRYSPDGKYALIRPDEKLILPNDICKSINNPIEDIPEKYDKAQNSNPIATDPILIDLNGDGIKTVSVKNGINIDHQSDGFAEKSAWVSNEDGVLFIDRNKNGIIDNGNELFGENYIKSNGTKATTGFDALTDLDSNNDGVIDSSDTQFSNLKVQKGDGTILSLGEAGISSINLDFQNVNQTDENGNIKIESGTFVKEDGSIVEMGSYNFQLDKFNSQVTEEIIISEEVSELPDVSGYGKVYSLHQAMMKDTTGALQELVEDFVDATNDDEKISLINQILIKWTNSDSVVDNSRGENIDAKKLAVIEAFIGRDFYSTYDAEHGDVNANPTHPNQQAGELISTMYEKLVVYVYAELSLQTNLQSYFNKIDFLYDFNTNSISCNLDNLISSLQSTIALDETSGKDLVYQVAKMIKGLGLDSCSNFFDPKDDSCFYTTFTKDDRELKWLIDTIGKVPYTDEIGDGEGSAADDSYRLEEQGHFHSLSGDDVAYGSDGDDSFAMCSGDDLVDAGNGNDIIDTHGGNDIVYAGAGNDIIHASDGNDIIYGGDGDDTIYPDHGDDFSWAEYGNDTIIGGKGNDTIISMTGDDTFIFNLGDGQDTIIEHQGVDTLYFGPNITWEDLTFTQSENDMVISINNTTDSITIKDWFAADEDGVYRYNNHKIEIFEFADGSKHTKDEITVGNNTESITYNMSELEVCRLGLTDFSKIFDFVKNVWFPITQQ